MVGSRRAAGIVIAIGLATALAGCAAQSITASLPKVTPVAGEPNQFDGSTTEIYGRIAAGAMRCWFAVNGQLKKSHIFHADAAPIAKGGAVEVNVLERDLVGPKPWGPKAFRITLSPASEQTTIAVENLKMPDAIAAQMRADVFQWGQGGTECKLKPIEPPSPPPAPEPAKKKIKAKVKAAAQ